MIYLIVAVVILVAVATLAGWYYWGLFAMTKAARREFKKREAAGMQVW